MLRKILFALLLVPSLSWGATVTHLVATADSGQTPNTSGSYTPTSGDLQAFVIQIAATTQATCTLTSSTALTFTQVIKSDHGGGANGLYFFVADALTSDTSSQTVEASCASDEGTGSVIMGFEIDGMSKAGFDGGASDAIVQTAIRQSINVGSDDTPDATFSGSALTGNVTVLFIGNATNPAGITEPSGWTEGADTGYDSPTQGAEYSYRNSGFTGTLIEAGTSASSWGTIAVEFDTSSSGTAVNFTSGPTVAAAANGYTISGTLNGSGFGSLVAYSVGVSPGDGTPTCTQVKAGQNDGGTSALLAANETWTTDVGDSFSLAAANSIARMDVHTCASDGTNDTSVTSATDQNRSARSGFALVVMASHSSTGLCNLDSYFDPDCADGDVFEYEDDTNESADCNVAISTAGEVTLTPVSAGDCDGRQSFEISYEDVSSATTGLFTSPSSGNFTTDDTVYVNNNPPVCDPEPTTDVILLIEDAAMTARDMAVLGGCQDDDGDALSASITVGTIPTGTALGGTGNLAWTGTPTTENEAGATLTVQICDTPGDCTTYQLTVYTVNTWTVPNLDDLDTDEAETAVIAAAPWRALDAGLVVAGYVCGSGQSFLNVAAQDPAASAEASPLEVIDLSLVGAVLPDLTGMTAAAAIAAIEAICP